MERMKEANPAMHSVVATDRGHAPFLDEPEVLAAIDGFLAAENL
jgi:pimeloyl-ACP methyl ester carboxylesterase